MHEGAMQIFALALCGLLTLSAASAADPTVTINSRGQMIRAVLLKPQGRSEGSVILLAGGNGRLDITAAGEITKLATNQLVRSRAKYKANGYVTLVPDLAPDMKVGSDDVVSGYRVSLNYAKDIGAMVAYLRAHATEPVVVIGTSRGSGGAANAVAKLSHARRPDAAIYTSAFLPLDCSDIINLWCLTGDDPQLLDVPTLVMWHVHDGCPFTPPSAVSAFRTWWEQGTGLTLSRKSFTGGKPPQSGPCDAKSPHGFWGLDQQVVDAATAWIAGL
jgi:pimeloyl-ACP methyl ester carboxylesterase